MNNQCEFTINIKIISKWLFFYRVQLVVVILIL
jgi:hypothetical protein